MCKFNKRQINLSRKMKKSWNLSDNAINNIIVEITYIHDTVFSVMFLKNSKMTELLSGNIKM